MDTKQKSPAQEIDALANKSAGGLKDDPERGCYERNEHICGFKEGYSAAPTLKWKRIDPNNLPTEEVIAIQRVPKTVMAGTLYKDEGYEEGISCSEEGIPNEIGAIFLPNCTHYLLVSDLLNLEKE